MFLDDTHLRSDTTWVGLLLNWYDANKRDFPWRREISVYHTWICEIMSQQTTMAVVVPRFEKFISVLPTLADLAACSDEVLRELWSGLGYYARARNLRKGAEYILAECDGRFPTDYDGWLEVPGVGPYTASVIASICFVQPKACVDGNVIRVIARLTGCASAGIWTESGRKQIQQLVDGCIDGRRPGDFNQAMMELGATVCHKQSPDCARCPLQSACHAVQGGVTQQCPPNKPRKQMEEVCVDALRAHTSSGCETSAGSVLLVARKKGFLSKTVGFPLFKDSKQQDLLNWLQTSKFVNMLQILENGPSHTITNHAMSVRVLDVQLSEHPAADVHFVEELLSRFPDDFTQPCWVSKSQTHQTVASSLDRKIWEKISLF